MVSKWRRGVKRTTNASIVNPRRRIPARHAVNRIRGLETTGNMNLNSSSTTLAFKQREPQRDAQGPIRLHSRPRLTHKPLR